jgi:hypothetical protein
MNVFISRFIIIYSFVIVFLFIWAKRPTATPVNVGKRTDTELRGKSLTISVLKYYVFS